jgi:hypothetical protein
MQVDLLTQIRAAGLPEPQLEARVCADRRWRWDLYWPRARAMHFQGLAVEFQGGTWTKGAHVRGKQYDSDCEKLAEGQLQGLVVLWVTTDMIKDGRALMLIEAVFRRSGYSNQKKTSNETSTTKTRS